MSGGIVGYRVVLFALTGIGNSVLQSLVSMGCRPTLLVTRREKGEFPYYPLPDISTVAAEMGIPVSYGEEGEKKALNLRPDIIIVATYHRMLSSKLVASARYAFNLHPSLLPKYRGPCPFFWALMNGESETGITAHYITDEVDDGDIVLQKRLTVLQDETQGSLRQRLAILAAEAVRVLLGDLAKGNLRATKQDAALSTYYPKISDGQRYVDFSAGIEKVMRQIRALTPWPGAMLEGGVKIKNIHRLSSGLLEWPSDSEETLVIKIDGVPFMLEVDRGSGEAKG